MRGDRDHALHLEDGEQSRALGVRDETLILDRDRHTGGGSSGGGAPTWAGARRRAVHDHAHARADADCVIVGIQAEPSAELAASRWFDQFTEEAVRHAAPIAQPDRLRTRRSRRDAACLWSAGQRRGTRAGLSRPRPESSCIVIARTESVPHCRRICCEKLVGFIGFGGLGTRVVLTKTAATNKRNGGDFGAM